VNHDLELVGLSKIYPNGTPAVADFNLQVAKGEFISFVGPSGCGKTSTLRMIAGFESISAGDILIRGRNVSHLPPEKRPTSTIFQDFALFPHLSVRENIEYGLRVRKLPAAERKSRVDRMLDPIADRRSTGLSGGQRQRTALARGLVVMPDILLLDEPLGALDANLRKSIQHELKLLQREVGITFIFVTHAQSEALVLSDRIVVMNRGRVEQISSPYQLYTRPATEFVARFMGRNAMRKGRVIGLEGGIARVETPFGVMAGVANDAALRIGAHAAVVIPSEAMLFGVGAASTQAPLGGSLHGLITARIYTGQAVRLALQLVDGSHISVERQTAAATEQAVGSAVALSWAAAEATVITCEPA
jgi:ABC-type Fe3+/spermidine/putrescine transport system ATPase subunit